MIMIMIMDQGKSHNSKLSYQRFNFLDFLSLKLVFLFLCDAIRDSLRDRIHDPT